MVAKSAILNQKSCLIWNGEVVERKVTILSLIASHLLQISQRHRWEF